MAGLVRYHDDAIKLEENAEKERAENKYLMFYIIVTLTLGKIFIYIK